jgi:hypothetical protein
MPVPPDDLPPPTLAEILAACLAVQAIYAARDAAAAAQDGPPARQAGPGPAIVDEYNLPEARRASDTLTPIFDGPTRARKAGKLSGPKGTKRLLMSHHGPQRIRENPPVY